MSTDLSNWLEGLGLGQYAGALADNHIDFALLGTLGDADLKELGLASLGHRKRLLAAIAGRVAVPEPAAPNAGERRQVTILFADLSGFTALSQTLDPEDLRDLVARYTSVVDGIVVSYGGTVDKHIGDAVMALFGAPLAHDDDPLRAARTALDIHDALVQLSHSIGRVLQAHIGIASGEVVAGAVGRAGTQDYSVMGDSVNLAARLVAAAGPGQTLIADAVHRALGGRAFCDALGDMSFKGIVAPVRVWSLQGVAGEPASASGSAFVGRAAELEQFKASAGACLARQSGQVIHIRGEAGIGKTRLVGEMRRFAEARGFTCHRGLAIDFGMGKSQGPIRVVLCSLLDLSASDTPEQRRLAAESAVAEGRLRLEQLMFLYDLLDLPQSAEQRALYDAMDNAARNRGKRALVAGLVEDACRRGPVMIVVEDLHWADPLVLGHLGAIAVAAGNAAGLLVMTSRVEGDPLDAAWRTSCRGTPFATIDLGPLRHEEALSLADGFIDATEGLTLACIERADGNPLFLEQLLRNAEEGMDGALPASIQSLVLARMDRLAPLDRQAFQAASVIGQRFDLTLLRHLVGGPDYACDGLLSHALVLPEGDGFLFAHALIKEGAYSSLLRARRRELHRLAAGWFAPHDPVLRAQHLDRAEDASAPKAYLDAATALRAGYHADTALQLAERGLAIVSDPAERHNLACLKGELQRDLGEIAASILTYREAVAVAPDETSRCRAEIGLAEGLRVSEGLADALELLEQAQQVAERHDLVPELARLYHLRGNILFPLGKIERCREAHEQGLVYAQRLGSPEAEARALGGLADAAYAQGRMRSAFDYFSRCVALSHEHGFGRIEVANRSMVGFSRLYVNEAQSAREDGAAAVRAAIMVGQPRAELLGETMGLFACLELGEFAAAEAHTTRALQLARLLGARRFEAQTLGLQGRVLLHSGRRAEAEIPMRQALAICAEIGLQFSGPIILGILCRAVGGEAERAQLMAEAEVVLHGGSVGHSHLWFYRDAIEAMLEAGDAAGARRYAAMLEDYTRAELLPWSDLFIARGRALAAVMEGQLDNLIRRDLESAAATLRAAGMLPYLPPIEAALAS